MIPITASDFSLSENGNILVGGYEWDSESKSWVIMLPPELVRLQENGGGYDLDDGIAWDKDGLVMFTLGEAGEWIEQAGIARIPAGDGSGAPDWEVPYYATMEDALWAVTDELPWGERAYTSTGHESQLKEISQTIETYMREIWKNVYGFERMNGTVELKQSTNEDESASIVIKPLIVYGRKVTVLTYASKETDYYFGSVIVDQDFESLYQAMLVGESGVYVPGPEEVRE